MDLRSYPKEFLKRLKSIKSKRAKIVIDHILKHGYITTEELSEKYGYEHPPRAARDVREQGIPLETFKTKNSEGRTIAAYRFADPTKARKHVLGGRRILSKALKDKLIQETGSKCLICLTQFEGRYLQIDHRIPYEVADDLLYGNKQQPKDFMLLCGSCNRAKSWSCEHCVNWVEVKNPKICQTCYWANPASYKHIALRPIRRLDIVWTEEEVEIFERLRNSAVRSDQTMPDYVKAVLRNHIDKTG